MEIRKIVGLPNDVNSSNENNGETLAQMKQAAHVIPGEEKLWALPSREANLVVDFDIRDLLPNLSKNVSGNIQVTAETFRPDDEWAQVLRVGLERADLSGRGIEIGVGAGVNLISVLDRYASITNLWGSDIDAHVAQLAALNVRAVSGIPSEKFTPILGSSDLLDGFRNVEGNSAALDFIFACIPQVRLPADGSARPDQLAHYYSGPVPEGFEEFDHYDMTLNARLLMQAGDHLTPGSGKIILNLAGRVPLEVLKKMFAQTGFGELSILNEAIIHQHTGTRLTDFIKQEKEQGITFEFFSCPECGSEPISAKQAQALIDSGLPAFHKLYVIQATYLGLQ